MKREREQKKGREKERDLEGEGGERKKKSEIKKEREREASLYFCLVNEISNGEISAFIALKAVVTRGQVAV